MTEEKFKNPPGEYRSFNFWSLNDKLEVNELRKQITEFAKAGMGGICLHARVGLITPYMENEWWEAMDTCVQEAQKLGLDVWFYDEDGYPSGFAAGKVSLISQKFSACCLLRVEKTASIEDNCTIILEDEDYVYVLSRAKIGNPNFNGGSWVDLFNGEAVKCFIDEVYYEYAKRYAQFSCVKGIFTDEPQISASLAYGKSKQKFNGAVSYSEELEKYFDKRFGYSLRTNLPLLFEKRGNWRKIRADYITAVGSLFEESYIKQLSDFCNKYSWELTGHFFGEENFEMVSRSVGNLSVSLRHMHRPGIDHLGLNLAGEVSDTLGYEYDIYSMKMLSSVANQYGIERRLAEVFGICGQDMDFEDRKWLTNYLAVMGINSICQHLSLYSLRGKRKRDYPPTFSYHQPWFEINKLYEDYAARVSMVSSLGKSAAQVLVISPLESNYMNMDFCGGFYNFRNNRSELFDKFYELLKFLHENHIDYDIADEQIISDIGSVDDGFIKVGEMKYSHLVVAYAENLRNKTFSLIRDFVDKGGRISVCGKVPAYFDYVADSEKTDYLCNCKKEMLKCDLNDISENENIWIQKRIIDGQSYLIAVNLSRKESRSFEVLNKNYKSIMFPENGRINALEGVVTLSPAGCVILSEAMAEENGNGKKKISGKVMGVLKKVSPNNENILVLDYAKYSTGTGELTKEAEPVIAIFERLSEQQYNGRLLLSFEFVSNDFSGEAKVLVESPDMYDSVICNGEKLSFKPGLHTPEKKSFMVIKGKNEVTLELFFNAPAPLSADRGEKYGTEIENIYIFGDFYACSALKEEFKGKSQRSTSKFLADKKIFSCSEFELYKNNSVDVKNIPITGYPFYCGSFDIVYECIIYKYDSEKSYIMSPGSMEAIAAKVFVNGVYAGALAWQPYNLEIGGLLRKGKNVIVLRIFNSLRNLLGPHHNRGAELIKAGPESFSGKGGWTEMYVGETDWYEHRKSTTIWTDEYYLLNFGADENIVITEMESE